MSKKILIVKPSSLGDIIHSLPLLHSIKSSLPDSTIHWVIAHEFKDILEDHPLIDRLWVIHKNRWRKLSSIGETLAELRGLFKNLRAEHFDTVIDLQGLLRSGLITASTAAPVRIGFSDAREMSHLFYNASLRGGKDLHAVERYLKLADLLGIEVKDCSFPLPPVGDTGILEKPYYVVAPGARWKTKQWPADHFVDVINSLSSDSQDIDPGQAKAVIIGCSQDIQLAKKIAANTAGHVINMAGKTDLKQLMSIIKDASFLLTNDTGPMHIAAALSVPVFGIFGPTSEGLTGPYGNGHTVFKSDIECSPCYRKKCRTITCMTDISPDEIIKKIVESYKKF
jgi:heptosyltransferase-1